MENFAVVSSMDVNRLFRLIVVGAVVGRSNRSLLVEIGVAIEGRSERATGLWSRVVDSQPNLFVCVPFELYT